MTHVTATSRTFGEERRATTDGKCLDSQRPHTTHCGCHFVRPVDAFFQKQ
eukprot:CAMPEP_0195506764 /NCGR_PEP_ID=MMETSP0794_2-20130614/343_1 /TAXON_ID=515487 /ORGANISM="Stephanopyxis turris, Strain CCMP 815" /LENGTH=49 /DNA_ID= /DNA_START= /DNA_END= /DNA_ORIENTATION=